MSFFVPKKNTCVFFRAKKTHVSFFVPKKHLCLFLGCLPTLGDSPQHTHILCVIQPVETEHTNTSVGIHFLLPRTNNPKAFLAKQGGQVDLRRASTVIKSPQSLRGRTTKPQPARSSLDTSIATTATDVEHSPVNVDQETNRQGQATVRKKAEVPAALSHPPGDDA